MTNPFRELDDEAREMLAGLLATSTYAALAVTDPSDGFPNISRIAFARAPDGRPMSLISDLSSHAGALKAAEECALLVGEPPKRGDPLTHPRLSIRARARFVRHGESEHAALAACYLEQRPKAKLYIGFGDFSIVLFEPRDGLLNGGFGKAFPLMREDILAT